jgi:hypothetical protein
LKDLKIGTTPDNFNQIGKYPFLTESLKTCDSGAEECN